MQAATTEEEFSFLGDNRIRILVPERLTGGAYTVMLSTTPPGAGGNQMHTDPFLETFYALDQGLEFTIERDGNYETRLLQPGEVVTIPEGVRHRFTCVGPRPARALAIGVASFERFFRALAAAWQGPWDDQRTPRAVGPVFEEFGVRPVQDGSAAP